MATGVDDNATLEANLAGFKRIQLRRGTDIYKALASGARGVGIGRPYIYGLAAFGQQGVERVVEILRAELTLVMKQCGTPAIKEITPASIARAR